MAKYLDIADMLERRITHGDYILTPFPSVRELMVEVGVSYVTAQKVMRKLQDDGLLVRTPNGRLAVTRGQEEDSLPQHIAFLDCPPKGNYPMTNRYWVSALECAAADYNVLIRHVLYTNWDDPVFVDALSLFDGIFLVPLSTAMPEHVIQSLRDTKRVVIVDGDMSNHGIPSYCPFPRSYVQLLLDHLASLGHTRIDCLNTQPMGLVIEDAIKQWRLWMAMHNYQGALINEPVVLGGTPFGQAYEVMDRLLSTGQFSATALFCVTDGAAIGAMRAFRKHGIRVGHDVALCTINGGELAPYFSPSLTSMDMPDAAPFFRVCIRWMLDKAQHWVGPLLIHPSEVVLAVRESTVPAINLQTLNR